MQFFGDYIDISEGYEKHIPGKRKELCNLKEDTGEQNNLADSHPELVTELENDMDEWIT